MIQGSAAGQESRHGGRFDILHARILRFYPEVVTDLGGDPDRLMRQVGIDPRMLADGKAGTTYRQVIQLFELTAAELDCTDFGMRLARRQGGAGMFGPLGAVMKNSRTFGDALDYSSKHSYAHSLAARIWLKRTGDRLFVGHDILLDGLPHKSQTMEQILLAGHLVAQEITHGRAGVREVHFRHQPLSPPQVYRRNFGCEVRFGREQDGVVFSDRDLAAPVVSADARIYQAATAFIESNFTRRHPPLHAQARGLMMQFLGTELCRNERIAAELNLHPRTMHRRLREEGTSFQKVKDEVRRDFMLYYLQETDLDFTYISERLGFAEQSVLTRSCNHWFGTSPTSLRSQVRGG